MAPSFVRAPGSSSVNEELVIQREDRLSEITTLAECLESLSALVGERGSSNSSSIGKATMANIVELQQKLTTREFYLAVLGLFKRGKSTLINALLQSDILPSGVVPVTSVITKVRYGDSMKARVSFSDATTKDLSIAELPAYITEKGNPANVKGVIEADVWSSSPLLQGGVTIIDTPGVGSTYLGGTETTYSFLERADACVFALAVDPPIGKEELDLLKAIRPYAKKMVFVLNKKDYIDERGLDEATDFCRDVLRSSLGLEEVRILPISAKWALDGYAEHDQTKVARSGINALESALDDMIRRDKQEILIASTATKALKLAEDFAISQEVAIKSATMPMSQLEHALGQVDAFLKSVESKRREILYLADVRSKEIVNTLDEDLERFRKERSSDFVAQLESYANQLLEIGTSARKTSDALEAMLKSSLIKEYSGFVASEDPRIESRFRELVDTFKQQIDSLVTDVREKVSTLFGISIETASFSPNLTREHRFYYHLESLFPADPMLLGEMTKLLPGFLFKGVVIKKIRELANEAFDGTAGRVRYDYFIVRLDKGILELKRDLGQSLDSSIFAAREAIVEGSEIRRKGSQELEVTLNGLSETLGEIQSVKKRLGELLSPSTGERRPC